MPRQKQRWLDETIRKAVLNIGEAPFLQATSTDPHPQLRRFHVAPAIGSAPQVASLQQSQYACCEIVFMLCIRVVHTGYTTSMATSLISHCHSCTRLNGDSCIVVFLDASHSCALTLMPSRSKTRS